MGMAMYTKCLFFRRNPWVTKILAASYMKMKAIKAKIASGEHHIVDTRWIQRFGRSLV